MLVDPRELIILI